MRDVTKMEVTRRLRRIEGQVGGLLRMVEDDRPHLEEPSEKGGHAPELILAPVFIGMVVTLRAVEAASEEDANLFGHHIGRRTDLVVGKKVPRGCAVALRGDGTIQPRKHSGLSGGERFNGSLVAP